MNKYCYYYYRGWENCATPGYAEVASKNTQLAIISNNYDNNGDFDNVQLCNTAKNSDHKKLFLSKNSFVCLQNRNSSLTICHWKAWKKQFCHTSEYQSPVTNFLKMVLPYSFLTAQNKHIVNNTPILGMPMFAASGNRMAEICVQ